MNHFVYVDRLSPFLLRANVAGHEVGLRWYGLAYVAGFALGIYHLRRAVRMGQVAGLTAPILEKLAWVIMAALLVGGRTGFVAQHARQELADPLFLLRVWEGGMAFYGGLAGVLGALAWGAIRFRLSFWGLADALTLPAALGLGFGRLANFINGELVGRPTDGSWGVVFPQVDGLPRHPSQLYEGASQFLLWALLALIVWRAPVWVQGRAGRLSAVFLLGYGAMRFATDFYRSDDTFVGPFSTGQWASGALALGGLVLLHTFDRRNVDPDSARPNTDKCGSIRTGTGSIGASGTAAKGGEAAALLKI